MNYNIRDKHAYLGEKLGAIKKIYKWDENNPYDKINIYKSDGKIDNYPVCYKLFGNIDYKRLYEEYLEHEKNLVPTTGNYLKYWFDQRGVDWKLAKDELTEVNFVPESHKQFNIMTLEDGATSVSQWTKFMPWVKNYTREVLSVFKSTPIRARYSIAKAGWHLNPHIDFPHPSYGGFRIHIPILTESEVKTYFLINDEWCDIYFEPGYIWYMNVSVPHKIYHEGKNDRIYLTLDLWEDTDIPCIKQYEKINYLEEKYNK